MWEDEDTREEEMQSKGFYIFNYILFFVFSMTPYRVFVFQGLQGKSIAYSRFLLWALAMVLLSCGYLATKERQRTYFGVLISLVVPFEIYTLLAYRRFFPAFSKISIAISVILSVFYLVWIWIRPRPENRKKKTVVISRIRSSLFYTRNILALVLLPFMITVCVRLLNYGSVFLSPRVSAVTARSNENEEAEAHMDMILKLQQSEWEKLSSTEKLDVLQTVVNIEKTATLGVPHEIYVRAGVLDEENGGYYRHSEHSIMINIEELENGSARDALTIAMHECQHAYQWCLAELYESIDPQYRDLRLLSTARDYSENLNDYQQAGDDYESYFAYFDQIVEQDAWRFGAATANWYLDMIDEYLGAEQSE